MRASIGVGNGDIGDAVDAKGVVEGAVVAQDTAVAVGGVFTEADVCDDEEVREAPAQEADGGNNGATGVISGGAEGVFGARGNGDTEENDGAEAFADEWFEVCDKFIDAAAGLVGKGGDEGFFVVLVGNKEGVYEHGLRGCKRIAQDLGSDRVSVPLSIVSRPATTGREDDCSRHVIDLICLLICSHLLQLYLRMIWRMTLLLIHGLLWTCVNFYRLDCGHEM